MRSCGRLRVMNRYQLEHVIRAAAGNADVPVRRRMVDRQLLRTRLAETPRLTPAARTLA
jgi:hypothetical protein